MGWSQIESRTFTVRKFQFLADQTILREHRSAAEFALGKSGDRVASSRPKQAAKHSDSSSEHICAVPATALRVHAGTASTKVFAKSRFCERLVPAYKLCRYQWACPADRSVFRYHRMGGLTTSTTIISRLVDALASRVNPNSFLKRSSLDLDFFACHCRLRKRHRLGNLFHPIG